MENNVVTLATAQKLKAAGFPQGSYFSWFLYESDYGVAMHEYSWSVMPSSTEIYNKEFGRLKERVLAPTAQELADKLRGKGVGWALESTLDRYQATIFGVDKQIASDWHATLAEALAELWLAEEEGKS